jgi:hypothetical protein
LTDGDGVDLAKAARSIAKHLSVRNDVEIVSDRDKASIVIIVTSIRWEELSPGTWDGPPHANVARATLTRGAFTTEFAAVEGALLSSATGNLARRIDVWFEKNKRTLATLP